MRVLLLLALVGLALGQVQLGSFEGTYTSSLFGQGTWVCQDDDFVQGSYDEVGIFHCLVNEDGTCVGEFFDAGSGPCVYGSVEISVTAEGFSGFFTCNELEGEFAWAESKLSPFRPTDSQCRLLLNNDTGDDDDEDDLDIQGRWSLEGVSAEHEDICFFDGFTAESSYEYTDDTGAVVEGFSAGVFGYGGKVMVGTWYEDFSAGPIIYFLRNNFELDVFWWTGLEGRDGLSVVNPLDFNDPSRHGVDQLKDRTVTSENQCRRFEILRPFVLQNLDAADDNDDYFYFVGDYFNPIYGFPYYLESSSSSDAAALAVSGVAALAALAALL